MSDVTHLLDAAAAGDRQAAAAVLPLVYDELRKLAAARMAAEPAGHTLDPTALVHEAYARLVGPAADAGWDGRGHFFAAAAEAMRRVLVDAARRKAAAKRGGAARRVALDGDALPAAGAADPADLLAINDALARLAAEHPQAAAIVTFRYFTGLPMADAAGAAGVPLRTAERLWAFARAWLYKELAGDGRPGPG